MEIRIADGEGGALPQGEIGMIEVRGPNVFQGYWNMPEKTAAEFRKDGFFITGDMGMVGPDGYLRIVGRGKDLIITGGLNVYPREIEACWMTCPAWRNPRWSACRTRISAKASPLSSLRAMARRSTEEQIQEALRDRLARFKQPKRVLFLKALPRNTMGKVQKAALRDGIQGPLPLGQRLALGLQRKGDDRQADHKRDRGQGDHRAQRAPPLDQPGDGEIGARAQKAAEGGAEGKSRGARFRWDIARAATG